MAEYSEIKLVLDQSVLDEYNKVYFEKYPRRYKPPIDRPIHPSINVWAIMRRKSANDLKQKWKEMIVWWIKSLGYQDMKLDNFELTVKTYMPTRRRFDADNTVPKFILDGFTESGFIIDDDTKHLKRLILEGGYDKDNPRTEIMLTILDSNQAE